MIWNYYWMLLFFEKILELKKSNFLSYLRWNLVNPLFLPAKMNGSYKHLTKESHFIQVVPISLIDLKQLLHSNNHWSLSQIFFVYCNLSFSLLSKIQVVLSVLLSSSGPLVSRWDNGVNQTRNGASLNYYNNHYVP